MIAAALTASKVASAAPAVVELPVVRQLQPGHPFSGKQPDLPVPPAALQVSDVSRIVACRGGLMWGMLGGVLELISGGHGDAVVTAALADGNDTVLCAALRQYVVAYLRSFTVHHGWSESGCKALMAILRRGPQAGARDMLEHAVIGARELPFGLSRYALWRALRRTLSASWHVQRQSVRSGGRFVTFDPGDKLALACFAFTPRSLLDTVLYTCLGYPPPTASGTARLWWCPTRSCRTAPAPTPATHPPFPSAPKPMHEGGRRWHGRGRSVGWHTA